MIKDPAEAQTAEGLEVVVCIFEVVAVLVSIAVCFISLIIIEIRFLEKFATNPDRADHQNFKKPSFGAEIPRLRAWNTPNRASAACGLFFSYIPLGC